MPPLLVPVQAPTEPRRRSRVPRWSSRTGASAGAHQVSLRRFRTLNLTSFLPLLTAVGVLGVVRQAQTWPQAVVLGLGLATALVTFERWTAGELRRVAAPCLAVAALVWPYGAFTMSGGPQSAYFPLALAGSLVIPHLPRHRLLAAVGLVGYVAAVGVAALLWASPAAADDLVGQLILPTGLTALMVGLMFPNKGFYDIVAELEESRDRDAELAVVRERMRFASDLHDIQGHTLHVVKLKIALARKLLHGDPERAERELSEVYTLVGDTIAQTKELAFGQRRLNLSAELENAKQLLEAAGMTVRVDCRAEANRADDLLAQVLRETTTNILRHSRATLVRIGLSESGLAVVNDGVDEEGPPDLHGLADLARRVADAGGELTVERGNGRFRTAATIPGDRAASPGGTHR